jgi:lipopolysaccharide/colanic/teichoic acid biosynthesis glycosyltransferase
MAATAIDPAIKFPAAASQPGLSAPAFTWSGPGDFPGRADGLDGEGTTWTRWRRLSKRTVDLVLALAGLLVLAPLFLLLALAIRLESDGPVLFRQRRCGWGNQDFELYKLRSMVEGADRQVPGLLAFNGADGLLFKVPADPRVTPVGALLRRFSLDELPQLVNVVKGEMSLVGPRPLPVAAEAFSPAARRRHQVRPGLTGPWQVAGRSRLSYDRMVEMDLEYVRHSSLATDLALIFRTIPAVLRGDGAF